VATEHGFTVTMDALMLINPNANPNCLKAGQRLFVPAPARDPGAPEMEAVPLSPLPPESPDEIGGLPEPFR
jgi:hypothetical protein